MVFAEGLRNPVYHWQEYLNMSHVAGLLLLPLQLTSQVSLIGCAAGAAHSCSFDELMCLPLPAPKVANSSASVRNRDTARDTHTSTMIVWQNFKSDVKTRLQAPNVEVCWLAL